jgi:hypothetical protein
MEEFTNRKEQEALYEERLKEWRRALDTKQKELDGIASKMILPIDSDILRMRVTKDVEARFRVELETKTLELERMSDCFYDSKRQLEILKT